MASTVEFLARTDPLNSSCVVEKLVQAPGLDSTEVSAYFYCSRTTSDSRLQDPKAILLSLLRQLASPLPGLAIKAPIISVYSRETSRGSHSADLAVNEITILLTDLIQQYYEKVTLVLDALDECDARGRLQLLETFTNLTYNNTTTIVKTLISSRQDADIESHFMRIPNVSITATDNAADISDYVSKELGKRLLGGKATKSLRDRVEEELNAKANGVFRWVALQVDALCDPDRVYSQEDVEYLLPRLPETLEDTYSKILSDTDRLLPHARQMLSSIIKLLLCAIRPMTYEEIHEAVHILSGAQVPPFNKNFVRNILKMGHGLIVAEDETTRFIFAHLSVKEFFESRSDFSCEHAHALAAEACLSLYFRADFEERPLRGFRLYACRFVGRYCQKAGALRKSSKLRLLMQNFLLEEGSNNAFKLWTQDIFNTKSLVDSWSYDKELKCGHELTKCRSEPPLPLFMVCFYDFEEFVEPLILHREESLGAENYCYERPLEVATMYGSYNIVKALYESGSSARISPIRGEQWIRKAAQECQDLSIWSFVLDHTPREMSKAAITSVAQNSTLGIVTIPRILGNMTKLDARTLEDFLEVCTSLTMVHMVLNHPTRTAITISTLEAAVQNHHINPELTGLILSMAPYLRVTDLCFARARRSVDQGIGVMQKLLSHHSRCQISEEVVCKVIEDIFEDDVYFCDQLINHSMIDCITEDMRAAAVTDRGYDITAIQAYLLSHHRGAELSQQIVQRALLSKHQFCALLTRPECPPVSEESLYAMSEVNCISKRFGMVEPMTMAQCKLAQITDAYIQACAANRSFCEFRWVCRLPRAIPLPESAVYAATKNAGSGSHILRFLLQSMPDFRMEVSEPVLVQALAHRNAHDLVLTLAEHWGTLPVTERSLMVALKNFYDPKDVVVLLLQHVATDAAIFTDDVLLVAITGPPIGHNLYFLQYFMRLRPEFEIKEEHLEAAMNSDSSNNMLILRFLLSQKRKVPISVTLLEAAARTGNQTILELLMEQEGAPQPFPGLFDLLKKEPPKPMDQQVITFDDILSAASREGMTGYHYVRGLELSTTKIDDLLSKYDGPPIDNSRLVEVAAERADGKFVVQYILARYPETNITQRALFAAAENETALTTLLELLLERSNAEVSVELLKQAVGNKHHGTSMLELIQSKYPALGELSSDVIVTALNNPYCGRSIFQIILKQQPQLAITQEFIDAASENVVMAGVLLQTLLKHALELQTMSSVDLVYQKLEDIENGVRDSLFMAACYGDEAILRYLLSRGVALTTVSGELGTALNVAIYADRTNIVDILLEHGCDPNSYSHTYGTALLTACHKVQPAIVRALAKHCVDIDVVNGLGRTPLHFAARHDLSDVVKILIAQEASIARKDIQGLTPLHHAATFTGPANSLDLLIKSNASLVDEGDSAQWTPLHWAAYADATSAVTRLVEAGASRSILTVCGKTPWQIARFRGNFHLRPKLLPADDDVNDDDNYDEPVADDHDGAQCSMCQMVCLESLSRSRHQLSN